MKYLNETMLVALLITVFGSIVHATNQYKLSRSTDRPMTLVDVLILLPTSIFSGGMFGLFATLVSSNQTHLFIACGTGSFLGVVGLNAIAERVLMMLLSKKQ